MVAAPGVWESGEWGNADQEIQKLQRLWQQLTVSHCVWSTQNLLKGQELVTSLHYQKDDNVK